MVERLRYGTQIAQFWPSKGWLVGVMAAVPEGGITIRPRVTNPMLDRTPVARARVPANKAVGLVPQDDVPA